MKKFLSIIIPVYNVEKYLPECLDSCLNQDISQEDYEIICINDGSSDSSAEILAVYAQKHSNIRIITQPNSGVSVARNAGLDAARGEYIWFVDADDFIAANCLLALRTRAAECSADKLSFGHYEFENALSEAELRQAATLTLKATTTYLGHVVWESLYRRAFLERHSLRFREGISYTEDGLFLLELGRHDPAAADCDALLYFYRRNPSSATRTLTPEARQKRTASAHRIANILADYAIEDLHALQKQQAQHSAYIRVLMPTVRSTVIQAAQLPGQMRRDVLRKLSQAGIFPLFLYRKPRDWFPKKIHMSHTHMGLKGQVLDILNFYATTRWGLALLVLYYKLRQGR